MNLLNGTLECNFAYFEVFGAFKNVSLLNSYRLTLHSLQLVLCEVLSNTTKNFVRESVGVRRAMIIVMN